MKTKQMLSILTILAISLFAKAQDKPHCITQDCGFEPQQVVYLFADQVQLRAAPHTQSKVVKTLPIGTALTVLEKHENSWRYKGDDYHFYKVSFNGKEGYVLGGLIALQKMTIANVTHLLEEVKQIKKIIY